MRLLSRNIHMSRLKRRELLQFTMDSDCNVPDNRQDIRELLHSCGYIQIKEQKLQNGRLHVKGTLHYEILYISEEPGSRLQSLSGELPFDEIVNMEGCDGSEYVNLSGQTEDISATLINSRKLNVRSLITLTASAEELYSHSVGYGLEDSSADICLKTGIRTMTSVAFEKNDICRIKEAIVIPQDKPEIDELIYHDIALVNTDIRLSEDIMTMTGEARVFFIYRGHDDTGFEYITTELPVSCRLECSGCSADMVPLLRLDIASQSLTSKPDDDGEERIAELEMSIDINIRAYEEEEQEVLADAYSPLQCISPVHTELPYETLILRNNSRLWVSDRVSLPISNPGILRVCYACGNIRLDETHIDMEAGGIAVWGAVSVDVFYLPQDDSYPLFVYSFSLPVEKLIEVNDIQPDAVYSVIPSVDQVNITVPEAHELEIRAGISLSAIVFKPVAESFITDISVCEYEKGYHKGLPGITGYVVKDNDTLWDIAKAHCTTEQQIRELNGLPEGEPGKGSRLLLVPATK